MDHTTNGQTPHRVFFDAASAAYEDGSPPPRGYRPVKRFEDEASGFKAIVYQNDEGERIYAIAGTDDFRDFASDVRLGEGQFGRPGQPEFSGGYRRPGNRSGHHQRFG